MTCALSIFSVLNNFCHVQMLDIYIEIIEKIGYFRYFQKYHHIFQPWIVTSCVVTATKVMTLRRDKNVCIIIIIIL